VHGTKVVFGVLGLLACSLSYS